MLETDGARHWALRRLLQREFTARALAGYETFLRGLTAVTLDAAFEQSEFDFVKCVSADYPIRVLVRLMDVPDSMGDQFITWSNRLVGSSDPDYADVLADSDESEAYRDLPFRSPAALEVFAYGDSLAQERLGGTGSDLVSKMVNRVPEDGIPPSRLHYFAAGRGNETRVAHCGPLHPEAGHSSGAPEMLPRGRGVLAWASPVYHFRAATKDVELRGAKIRAGDKVVMWYGSGNRDSSVFDAPDQFDVTRNPNDHVTFGKGGPHFCLGNQLARLEVRIMIEELLRRDVHLEFNGEIEHVRSNLSGIKSRSVARVSVPSRVRRGSRLHVGGYAAVAALAPWSRWSMTPGASPCPCCRGQMAIRDGARCERLSFADGCAPAGDFTRSYGDRWVAARYDVDAPGPVDFAIAEWALARGSRCLRCAVACTWSTWHWAARWNSTWPSRTAKSCRTRWNTRSRSPRVGGQKASTSPMALRSRATTING